ncbi:hypothetical protein [Microbacterium sp. NPDC077486]|uniref:hypothetical protein n=1 Tax=Microbacterium sp. NPDC077486 TaxID=3154766 RepID=UPI003439086F
MSDGHVVDVELALLTLTLPLAPQDPLGVFTATPSVELCDDEYENEAENPLVAEEPTLPTCTQ